MSIEVGGALGIRFFQTSILHAASLFLVSQQRFVVKIGETFAESKVCPGAALPLESTFGSSIQKSEEQTKVICAQQPLSLC